MRYTTTRRIAPRGAVVVGFVDDRLKRRTLAVPYRSSSAADVAQLVEYVNEHVRTRPAALPLPTGK